MIVICVVILKIFIPLEFSTLDSTRASQAHFRNKGPNNSVELSSVESVFFS